MVSWPTATSRCPRKIVVFGTAVGGAGWCLSQIDMLGQAKLTVNLIKLEPISWLMKRYAFGSSACNQPAIR
jgi:hypothetical protein